MYYLFFIVFILLLFSLFVPIIFWVLLLFIAITIIPILLSSLKDAFKYIYKQVFKSKEGLTEEKYRECPYCKQRIKFNKTHCPYCGKKVIIEIDDD